MTGHGGRNDGYLLSGNEKYQSSTTTPANTALVRVKLYDRHTISMSWLQKRYAKLLRHLR